MFLFAISPLLKASAQEGVENFGLSRYGLSAMVKSDQGGVRAFPTLGQAVYITFFLPVPISFAFEFLDAFLHPGQFIL